MAMLSSPGSRRRFAASASGAFRIVMCAAAIVIVAATSAFAQAWTAYVNPRFGFSLYYPIELFRPAETLAEDAGATFSGKDGAGLRVEGAFDERRHGAKHYLGEALAAEANKNPVSQTLEDFSYAFTTDRGDMLYYERAVFSCREQVINKLSLTYPEEQKDRYEAILPKLVQRFHGGSGYATPDNCV